MTEAQKQCPDIETVRLDQELVMDNCGAIKERIKTAIDHGCGRMLIDLSNVPFMDSSGLAVLVMALKMIRAKHGAIALLGVAPEVRSLLELTRLHEVFDMFEDENAALDFLAGP